MVISETAWNKLLGRLSAISNTATKNLLRYVEANGGLQAIDRQKLIDYSYALATKYGEASSAMAAEWYDAVAIGSGHTLPPAVPADTATYQETAQTVTGTLNNSQNEESLSGAIERLIKMPSLDTTLNNALRDGAEIAWIPHGDTCAFCMMLASRGWMRASKNLIKHGHAEHIHSNCNCQFGIRFNGSPEYAGYDPNVYKEMYDNAEGSDWRDKMNSMRRDAYAKNRDQINAQKRAAYAKRIELNSSD